MTPEVLGRLLVAAQFALLLALAWPSSWPTVSIPALLAGAGAIVVGVWTLLHNRPGNFNVRPEPRATGRLVVSGPYRLVRHPMYVAVLLLAAALAAAYGGVAKAACLAALVLVLWRKSVLEERALRQRYPEYDAYARRTRRFIPFVF